jgi:hypothetical protein
VALHSSREHSLGTGSCLVRLNRPVAEVALGLLHTTYVQDWNPKLDDVRTCQRRENLVMVIGRKLEQTLWVASALHATGPWSSCAKVYEAILERNTTQREAVDKRLAVYIKDLRIHFVVCDEIEGIHVR